MSGHWVNGRAGCRCRHGHTSAQPATEDAPRWVYRSEARLAQDLIVASPELAGLADAGDVAAFLKARNLVVVCGHGTLVIEDTVGEPAKRPVSEAEKAGGIPSESSVPTGSSIGEDHTSGVAPTASTEPASVKRTPSPNSRSFKKERVAGNPIRSCGERIDRYGV
jgi:hypothetical protein